MLRELSAAGARVHILSGSPRQLRSRIETKLRMDGVVWDELTLKPNLSNAVFLRFRALRDQLGYKLPELLAARAREEARHVVPEPIREVLVGDDSESDAFVYSLYADLCEGKVGRDVLVRVLEAGHAYPRAVRTCRRALELIPTAPVVDRILIHLDGQTPPSHFSRYGDRLVPFYNYLQAAFLLTERGMLSPTAGLRIAAEFLVAHGFSPDTLARSYTELLRRRHADGSAPLALERALATPDPALPARPDPELRLAIAQMSREPVLDARSASGASTIDYVDLAAQYRGGRNRRRPGQRFA